MNPLSPVVYHLRHKRSVLLLVALLGLATVGLYVMVGVLDSIPTRARYIYLNKVSRIYPLVGDALEPGVVAQVETHSGVALMIPDNGLFISVPALVGADAQRLMGVHEEDVQALLTRFGVRLKSGRMFSPRTNEIVLSEELARALDLDLGDVIERSVDDAAYANVPAPLVLVGLLESDPEVQKGSGPRLGLISFEYLAGHELFAPRPVSMLVIPREGQQEAVEAFLSEEIASARTGADTFLEEAQFVEMGRRGLYVIFGVVNCLVAGIVAVVIGVINRMALMQRVSEMGLLHAIGYERRKLVRRLTFETATITGIGWIIGLGLARIVMGALKTGFYYHRGLELDLGTMTPLWFVIPMPLLVVVLVFFSARRLLGHFDAVAVIERGKLSAERRSPRRRARRSTAKPLSSWAFYLRHRRRGALLMVSMVLMILGVAFPAFLLSNSLTSIRAGYTYLRYASTVAPRGQRMVDAGLTAQIRSHPAVARVTPTIPLWLQILVPPGGGTGAVIYGVAESDLPGLLDMWGQKLVEGRLPRPRTNEIVLPKVAALNRGLGVGDAIGGEVSKRAQEENPLLVDGIPTEMVVVGLLDREDIWVGFASLEYLQSHDLIASRGVNLIVEPAAGRRADLERWLQAYVASSQTRVTTYTAEMDQYDTMMWSMMTLFALVESVIAIVAAVAMAALNAIFFAQRRDEFGTLYAIGRSRRWLTLRTVKETASITGLAWLAGAGFCILGLLGFQALVYKPIGLRLNVLSVAPWLFTLPIPLAVLLVTGASVTRTLYKLDAVSVIERK